MKLRKNISRPEISCRCGCGSDTMDTETLKVVQNACNHFAKVLGIKRVVLTVTSGHRCFKHNKAVGSTDKGQHPQARAMDIKIAGVLPTALYAYLNGKYPKKYGIGLYSTFVHIDTRTNGPARW